MFYNTTANELAERILKLIPENPQILEFKSAGKLFGVKKFDCDDLNPSLFQAQWALAKAKERWKENDTSD